MSDNHLWLLDATFKERDNTIELTYLQSPENTLKTIKREFIPYYYALPANLGEAVQRKDLMTNEIISVGKLPHNSSVKTEREWEQNLNPAMSYIYDQDQRFGCPHRLTETGIHIDLKVPNSQLDEFNSRFASTAQQDPVKFDFLKNFFRYTIQPLPPLPRDLLKLEAKYDDTQLQWGIMLARIANIPFFRALKSRSVSDWIRSMLHTSYRQLGILIPDPEELKKGHTPHRVEGALTIAPKPGAYYHMTVLDFEFLYQAPVIPKRALFATIKSFPS